MHAIPPAPAPHRNLPVWLPWLVAPAFALLPVAGCGAAAAIQHSRGAAATAHRSGSAPPMVPVTAVVTVVPPGR